MSRIIELKFIDRIPEFFDVRMFSWSYPNWQEREPDKKLQLHFCSWSDHCRVGEVSDYTDQLSQDICLQYARPGN